jgi:hypothetical protein
MFINKKTEGIKSRDTVPLIFCGVIYSCIFCIFGINILWGDLFLYIWNSSILEPHFFFGGGGTKVIILNRKNCYL